MILGHRHRYEPVAVQHVPAAVFSPAQTIIRCRCRCRCRCQVRGEAELRLAEASEEMLPR